MRGISTLARQFGAALRGGARSPLLAGLACLALAFFAFGAALALHPAPLKAQAASDDAPATGAHGALDQPHISALDQHHMISALDQPHISALDHHISALDQHHISALDQHHISALDQPHISALDQHHISALDQHHISALDQPHISALDQHHISALDQHHISALD
jgi:hypothetical protein